MFQVLFLSLDTQDVWICEGLEHLTSRGAGVLYLVCSAPGVTAHTPMTHYPLL